MFQISQFAADTDDRFRVIRRYLAASFAGHLIWEFAQLPLYTVWHEGTLFQRVWYPLHCTGGDVLIATISLLAAILILGKKTWPISRYWIVGFAASAIGQLYTIYSEWLNVYVRKSWAYSDLMPIVPGLEVGLAPLLQWLVIPLLSFRFARPR